MCYIEKLNFEVDSFVLYWKMRNEDFLKLSSEICCILMYCIEKLGFEVNCFVLYWKMTNDDF